MKWVVLSLVLLSLVIVAVLIFCVLRKPWKDNFEYGDCRSLERCPDCRLSFPATELKTAQMVMTRMLRIFDLLCQRYGITYWLYGGTLLGAYRHQGWIPWDGDVDVMIPLTEYQKFEKIAHHLPAGLKLENPDTVNKQGLAKIRDLSSCYVEGGGGLQVDLFISELTEKGWKPLCFGVPMKNKDVFPLKKMKFEGYLFPVPNNSVPYLKEHYGDFMTYPPVEKRYPHEGKMDACRYCKSKL